MMEFDKDTTLEKVMEDEEAQRVLTEHQVPCLGCPLAQFEMEDLTLEEICKRYGLDLDKILKELNNE